MAINGQISFDLTSGVGQTTNGSTSVTILTTPAFLATDGGQIITFNICGVDFTTGDIATAKVVVKVKNISGTVSIVGSPVHLVPISVGSSEALINAAVDVIVAGSDLKVNVIGVANKTIDWSVNRTDSFSTLNPWTAVSAPEDGYVNIWSATNSRWEPTNISVATDTANITGDITGTLGATVVSYFSGSIVSTQLDCIITGKTGGGELTLQGGDGYGGHINLYGGNGLTNDIGGSLNLIAGNGGTSSGSTGGNITITGGSSGTDAATPYGEDGNITITGGSGFISCGDVTIKGGPAPFWSSGSIRGGNTIISGGDSLAATGGNLTLSSGASSGTRGDITIDLGTTGSGKLYINGPTSGTASGITDYLEVYWNGNLRKIAMYNV